MSQAPTPRPNGMAPESNPLGLAGFIVSLVGLVGTCGLLGPVGLIMSLVALRKRPKGFAIAGAIIGLIASLWVVALVVLIGFGALAAVIALVFTTGGIETISDMAAVRKEAIAYMGANNGAIPASVDELTNLTQEQRIDAWGNPYRISLSDDGGTLRIRSNGHDGQPDTIDDLRFDLPH